MNNSEEERLIQRAKNGDRQAFTVLYRRYHPRVYRYIFFRVNDVPTAEDLTSEVFIRLVENIHRYHDTGRPILAWLYTIARNLVNDHYRRERRARHVSVDESLPSNAPDPASRAQLSLEQSRLANAMQQLTEDQRQVIVLRFFEEADNATVASLLDKTVGAVKALQHRALASLARYLADASDASEAPSKEP